MTILGTGCGSDSTSDGTDRFAGVPVSLELKQHLDKSLDFGDQPSDLLIGQQLNTYEHLTAAIQNSTTRQAAGDELYTTWRADPTNFLWIDLAAGYNYILRRKTERNAVYALPALADTSTAVGSFVKGRRFYGYGSRGEHFLRADSLSVELDYLQSVWLERRLATIESDEGHHVIAARRLLGLLEKARSTGGRQLTMHLWRDIARFLMRADRLDDALHAVQRAEEIATDAGHQNRVLHCRLTRADILEARSETDAAVDLYRRVIAESEELGSSWFLLSSLNRAASLFGALGDMEGALACDRRTLDHALVSRDSLNVPRFLMNVAYDHRLAGRLDSCLVYQTRAKEWVTVYNDKRNLAKFPRLEAEYYIQVGEYAVGDSLLNLASARSRHTGTAVDEAELLIALVQQGLEYSKPEIAYRALERLENIRSSLYDVLPDQNFLADIEIASADFYGRQGEYHRAYRALQRAEQAVDDGGGEGKLWEYRRCEGELALMRGDEIAARRAFIACSELADPERWPARAAESRMQLGRLYINQSLYDEARQLFEPVVEDSSFGGRFRVRLLSLLYRGKSYAGPGDHGYAIELYRRSLDLCTPHTPSELVAHLNLELGRSLAAMSLWDEAGDALDRARTLVWNEGRTKNIDGVRNVSGNLKRDIAEVVIGLALDRPHSLLGQDQILDLLHLAESVRTSSNGNHRVTVENAGTSASFFVGPHRSFVWVGTEGTWSLHPLPDSRTIAELVAPVLSDLRDPSRNVSLESSHRLTKAIMGPILDRWKADELLTIVPDGILNLVPWASLIVGGQMHLIEYGPVVTTISTRSEKIAENKHRKGPHGRLLSIGVDGDSSENGTQFDKLRRAEAEAASIAKSWRYGDATLRTGASGEWRALDVSELSAFQVIHIASHAVAHSGLNGAATLRLAGTVGSEPLTLQAIQRLHLVADLVYLSCCETASGTSGNGRAVPDFAQAFMTAGAGAVVASSIRVDDEASAILANLFYQYWQDGVGYAEALRRAQLEMIKKEGRRWRHPYYWASYRIID